MFSLVANSELLQLQPGCHMFYSWTIMGATKQIIMFTSGLLGDTNSLIVELAGSVCTEMPASDQIINKEINKIREEEIKSNIES